MRIRVASPETDLPGIVAVVNASEREPVTLDAVQRWFAHQPAGRISRRIVATDEPDNVIGYGVAVREAWDPDGHFYVWVGVDPAWTGRGVGLALAQDLEAFLHEHNATQLKSEVRDDDPLSLRFAGRNSFAIDRHHYGSTLDLATFDETPYSGLLEAQRTAGIRFFSLAEEQDSRAAREKLYVLNRATSADIPGVDSAFPPFEEYEQWVCGAYWYRPDGQLIAADGEQWVGLAAIQLRPATQSAYNLMTGVLRPYRGRKIALALKLLAIRYARQQNALSISTHNDSLNAPMLAINKKLGYLPEPGRYLLIRTAL